MSPSTKTALALAALYLAGGIATAAHSVYLASQGRFHFAGTANAGAVLGLGETVGLWPYALYRNLKGG